MWIRLNDENLIEDYKLQFHPTYPQKLPHLIVALLEQLQKKPYADKLAAVTSLGRLSLSTTLSYGEFHYRETPIYIGQTVDAGKDVLAIGFSLRNKKKDTVGRLCSLEEAAEYIDLYVMRMLLERYGEL